LLENYSADLEDQKKQSKEVIEETYELYQKILDKRKVSFYYTSSISISSIFFSIQILIHLIIFS